MNAMLFFKRSLVQQNTYQLEKNNRNADVQHTLLLFQSEKKQVK